MIRHLNYDFSCSAVSKSCISRGQGACALVKCGLAKKTVKLVIVQNIALLSHDFSRKPLRIKVRVDVTTKKMTFSFWLN